MKKILFSMGISLILVACNGGGSSSGSSFVDDPTPPSPTPSPGTYNGVPYSQLSQPTGLANTYPTAYFPTQLQIAYGRNDESQIANLTAYVKMGSSGLCSATPVKYESASNTTFLIGAAHCFVTAKDQPSTLTVSNLNSVGSLTVYNGVQPLVQGQTYSVQAVYLRQDYCSGGTFTLGHECPNFSPNSGSGTQGNDIAVIQIAGEYAESGASSNYPQVVPASQYPTPYTMAPILSIGYGMNTQIPDPNVPIYCPACSVMFYVANYQYWQQDSTPLGQGGYHYLYNSYYNNGSFGQSGYSSLICGGDSGGGDLFWNGSNWLLLSEHTYGPTGACGTFYSSLPNGATNVSAYYDWIQSILTDAHPVADCQSGAITNCVTNGN